MDLIVTGNTALLIPTPGQPEQEYLAEYLSGKFGFTSVLQDMFPVFDLKKANTVKTNGVFYNMDAMKKILDLHLWKFVVLHL